MEVAMGVTGWFVAPTVQWFINAGFDRLKDLVTDDMKEKLEKLQVILPNIQAVVDFASSQIEITNQNLNKWLWQLRDAIDEADDVLDDFEYTKHEQQLKTKSSKKKEESSTISSMIEELDKIAKRAFKTDPNLKRLEEVVNKLDQVSAGVGNFLYLLQNTKSSNEQQQLEMYESRETGPLPQNAIIGRGNEKEFVMQWLMSKSSNEEDQTTRYQNISLLSIVGHGGMGKTTLLQHVYNHENITKEFPLKMWVCVSTNFDAKKVIVDMLECLTKERPRLETLVALQESLESKVNSKKFLLVLDDIWGEEEHQDKSKWEKVLAPLAYGSLGSKILITSRMESVGSMMAKVIEKKKSETRKVKGLEENECLQLLNAHAFAGVENPDDHKKLRFITRKMVKKLSGYPLAAKIMGGVLNSRLDESHWRTVLNSTIKSIMPILRLSYIFLPKHLQRCFTFCSIFKQDFKFDKDDLVRMWIALGFIEPPDNQQETLEDIGGRYFDALVNKSFFDKFSDNHYKMHNLLHELAQSISKYECLRVERDQELFSKTPETIRHLFLQTPSQEKLKNIGKFKNLRSLFLDDYDVNADALTEIFNSTRSIRLLYIHAPYFQKMPQAIGCLTHLRHLKVGYSTEISEWPTSLCNLYHLQFIILQESDTTRYTFPTDDMNKLSSLRYLEFPSSLFPSIREIGKLTSLQELNNFEVKNEPDYRIGELKQMNNLQKLSINSLENVEDAQDACNAKLHDKRNLTDLTIKWGSRSNSIDLDDEKVIDNLQPPSCLQKLRIDKYNGVRSATWMNTADVISNLEIIELSNCLNWQTLPPFGQLRFLKSLHLNSMPEVKRFDNKFHGNNEHCVFPSLEELYIAKLEELEDWFDTKVSASDHYMFPCLTKLSLLYCPKLQELPYLPPKLNNLYVRNIGWKTLNGRSVSKLEEIHVLDCPNITNIYLERIAALTLLKIKKCPNLNNLGGHREVETSENCQLILSYLEIDDPSILLMELLTSITSLQQLDIQYNDELVSFPIEAEQWFPKVSSSLTQLNFVGLQSLQSLPSSLESLSSLENLSVGIVPQLRELPNLPPSLAELHLTTLDSLDYLPSCLSSLSSLKNLSIMYIPQLQELPNLPPSLAELRLENLDNLDCLPSCLPNLSSLKNLSIMYCPQLRELPNLPPSLAKLVLRNLDNLDCLPSCLPSLSSLKNLSIRDVPRLQDLPDLPSSLEYLEIADFSTKQKLGWLDAFDNPTQDLPDLPSSLESLEITEGHPDLMERYGSDEGSDRHNIDHIPYVHFPTEQDLSLLDKFINYTFAWN